MRSLPQTEALSHTQQLCTEYRLPGTRWEAVANQMADAWVHFVSRGNPNGAGGESTRAHPSSSSR